LAILTKCASQRGHLGQFISRGAIARNRLLNGVEELLVTERFREKLHGSSLHGLHRHWNVTMSSDEHDLDRRIHAGNLALKIKTAQSR